MWRRIFVISARVATAMILAVCGRPADARPDQTIVLNGGCQYNDRVIRHRDDTALILCDTATIDRRAGSGALDFGQRSWGSMARFTGAMAGDRMTVSQLALRDGRTRAATGTCEIFHRNDGTLSAISCLAIAGSQSVAANFIPSRL